MNEYERGPSDAEYTPPKIGAIHTEPSGKVELSPEQFRDVLRSYHRKGFDAARTAKPAPKEAQPSDAELLDSFTLDSRGPNPYYRCKEC